MSNLSAGTLAVRVPSLRFPPGLCCQSPPGQVLGPHALETPPPIPLFTNGTKFTTRYVANVGGSPFELEPWAGSSLVAHSNMSSLSPRGPREP
jgi:hypothetical protein